MEGKRKYSPIRSGEAFPSRLRELLEKHNEKQSDLAGILGVSRQSVGYYVSGNHEPDLSSLMAIAKHYRVSVDWLLGMPGAPDRIDGELYQAMQYSGLSQGSIVFLTSDKGKKLLPTVNEILSSGEGQQILWHFKQILSSYTDEEASGIKVFHTDGENTEVSDVKGLEMGGAWIEPYIVRQAHLVNVGVELEMMAEAMKKESPAPSKRKMGPAILTTKSEDDVMFYDDGPCGDEFDSEDE